MYAIFAMLFGLSFFIQHDNQAQRGVDFRPRFFWRMILLMLFGLFDLMFYNGDILFIYAVCGVLVIPFIRASNKVLVVTALFLMMQPVELFYIIKGIFEPSTMPLDLGSWKCYTAIYDATANGSLWDVHLAGVRHGLPANILWAIENGRMTQTVCFFLFGILLGRRRLFYNEGNNLVIWKKVLKGALIAFVFLLPAYYLVPKITEVKCISNSLNVMLNMWKNVSMMLMIVSGVTLLYYNTSAKNWLIKIAPYGKMSLTNYLTQSIFGGMLFYGWGYGLYQYCGHTASFMMGVGFIIIQFLFCTWWMKHHKRGPFEEIWNQATWFGKHA